MHQTCPDPPSSTKSNPRSEQPKVMPKELHRDPFSPLLSALAFALNLSTWNIPSATTQSLGHLMILMAENGAMLPFEATRNYGPCHGRIYGPVLPGNTPPRHLWLHPPCGVGGGGGAGGGSTSSNDNSSTNSTSSYNKSSRSISSCGSTSRNRSSSNSTSTSTTSTT